MTYQELKKRQQEEVNSFPFGFAFNNKQFEEMMCAWNLDANNVEDLHKIVSIGAGGYLRKQDIKAFEEMAARHEAEIKQLRKDEKEFIEAIVYQLHNHEYGYSRSSDDIEAAYEALGIGEKELEDKHIRQMLAKAIKQCVKEYNEMD